MTASSGLEKLMANPNKVNKNLRDSSVAQISAAIYYKASVISQLTSNKAFQKKFRDILYTQIEKDFGDYIDSQATTKPKSLHHVYEWGKAGVQEARLFKLKPLGNSGLSFRVGYEFKLSKSNVPGQPKSKKYKFANKAYIMENGIPVTIAPRAAERLVFEVNGYTVFMPKGRSVTVSRPGGGAVTHRFRLAYNQFFTGPLVGASIRRSGFQQVFNSKMSKALKTPSGITKVQYSFSPNTVRAQADSALHQAFGGSL